MAVTTHTLTGDFNDLIGGDIDPRLLRARVTTNVPNGQAIVDTTTGNVYLGEHPIDVAADGTFTVAGLPATNDPNLNITGGTLRYMVVVEHRLRETPGMGRWDSGWFELTADVHLGQVVGTDYIDPTFASQVQTFVTAEADRATAAADQAAAPTAEQMTVVDADPNSTFRQQQDARLSATFARLADKGEQLMTRLDQKQATAVLAVLGDSSGTGTYGTPWPQRLGSSLAGDYPAATINYRSYSAGSYAAPVVLASGAATTLDIYNGSTGSTDAEDTLANLATLLPVEPDAVVISHSHNHLTDTPAQFEAKIDALVDGIRAMYPDTSIILSGQNPQYAPTANPAEHNARQADLRRYARASGYGHIPVFEAFTSRADPQSYVLAADGVHPTDEGLQLWADTAHTHLSALALSHPGEISGTGTPEGIVTAPIGTRYTDRDATNGAVSWIKSSGDGDTGWRVEVGDTGWRQVPTDAGATTAHPSMTILVRRIGDIGFASLIEYGNASATPGLARVYLLPQGFRKQNVDSVVTGQLGNAGTGAATNGNVYVAVDHKIGVYHTEAIKHFASLTWVCEPAWPTTLPGVAV
ncbi:SGNH/GDSL hydrolase family protein [Nocardioides pakistanensis]